MARISSVGLPHLTCRSDAGQFTYHRGVRPALLGGLRPSRDRRKVALDARRVVEVSLGIGDRRLAVARQGKFCPLVQAAVGPAERDRVAPESLAPDAIRAMAGHVLHSALAEHDRPSIEPDHLNGTAQTVGKVLATGRADEREPADLRERERAFRERLYRDALHERRLDRLDPAIVEGEIASPAGVTERLRRDLASLSQDDLLAIARAPVIVPEAVRRSTPRLRRVPGRAPARPRPARRGWPRSRPARKTPATASPRKLSGPRQTA